MNKEISPKLRPEEGRRSASQDGPDPVDVHVGGRIRLRRTLLGLTQTDLGEALGLTFQQVQKYERGINRVSASRLHRLANVLSVPISFFFDGMDGLSPPPISPDRCLTDPESLAMLRNYSTLPLDIRKRVCALLSSLNKGVRDGAD